MLFSMFLRNETCYLTYYSQFDPVLMQFHASWSGWCHKDSLLRLDWILIGFFYCF